MFIEWEQQRALPKAAGALSSLFSLVADCCQIAEGVTLPCAVHICITGDTHLQQINKVHRQIDRATDVLSFPTIRYPKGKTARYASARLRAEMDPDCGGTMLGDIFLSLDHAEAQAKEYGHSLQRELCYLLAHGLFHLFGYDHMNESERKDMRHMEEKALEMAGISRDESADISVNVPFDIPAVASMSDPEVTATGIPAATTTDEELLALARLAMERAYVPYSRYKVGACLLSTDGRLFQGCNIENAAFGVTNCAERTALFKAVSEGALEFTTIAIAAESSAPYPCGACRQALNEFAPDIRVLVTWDGGRLEKTALPELLPHAFGPKSLP